LWFQYVVGYDKQEQRSLAVSLHNHIFDYTRTLTNVLTTVRSYFTPNVLMIVLGVILLLLGFGFVFFGKRLWPLLWRRGAGPAVEDGRAFSDVQFYEKLMELMEQRGVLRDKAQTPLEFAGNLQSSEVMIITRAYNRVRYGRERLSTSEQREVERALVALEAAEKNG
jgi:hypothetical protein